jgi:heme exporter protein B
MGQMNSGMKIWAIVRKDLALQRRSREMINSMLLFALIVILVFSFSFDLRVEQVSEVAPGVLWVTFMFAGMLGLGRSFTLESDQDCLDGLLLCPVDRSVIYFGKMLSNLLFISMVEVIVLPLYFGLFNLPFRPMLLPIILLGTAGFSAVGTLISAMAVHVRAREVMLPILLFPIVMPALIAAVKLTGGVLDGLAWSEMGNWLQLLVGFDVIFLSVSYVAFDYVVEK